MDTTTVNLVNQLTLAAAALIACGVLWRALNSERTTHFSDIKALTDDHIKDLRQHNEGAIFDLKARIMVIEDKDGINREDRFKYMPPLNPREQAALDDLDGTKPLNRTKTGELLYPRSEN